jgi:glycerophosphoryl diester phosphodiesterase
MSCLPLIIGHRGASHDAPENTLAAFQLAFEQGADGIEADFRLTRDHRIVCMHDETCGRTAGVHIPVEEASLNELKLLDVGSWKGEQWAGERIPTLDEVLAALPEGKMIFIEVKSGAAIVPHLREALARTSVEMERIRLLTFDAGLAGVLTDIIPEAGVCLNLEYRMDILKGVWRPSPDEIIRTLARCGAVGLSSQAHGSVDASFAGALRRNCMELHIWTVDSPDEALRYLDLAVDSLMTNRPGFLKEELS